MKAKELIKGLASLLSDGETLNLHWKIERGTTFSSLTNKRLTFLSWYRTQQDDSDFNTETIKPDRCWFSAEVDIHKLIADQFTNIIR